MTKKTYQIKCHCSNCGASEEITISQGQTIDATKCPHCGCKTLQREQEAYRDDGNWKRTFPYWYKEDYAHIDRNPHPWWYPPQPMC